jgi:nucleoside-diphosphate-sugar epimerase
MRKILVTGGLGYIGSVLIKKLLEDSYNEVTVFDNILYKQIGSIYDCSNTRLNLIVGDVRDKETIRKLVHQNDVVIPLAAIVGAPACVKYKEEATDINYVQIKDISSWVYQDQLLIMPNTNSQYGSSKNIITEDSPRKPLSHYAETKCMAEDEILRAKGIALRLATVFGLSPRMRMDLLVNDFTYKAATDGYLVLFEADFKRNYIHIQDVANAFVFMIDNYSKCKGNAYNVGLSSANLSKRELSETIKKYIPELVIKEEEFKKDIDQRNYIVSNAKIESLGWKPTKTIDDGVQELLKAIPMIKLFNNRNFTNL